MEKFKNIYKSLEGCGAGVPLLYNLLPVHSAKNDNVASKKSQKNRQSSKKLQKTKRFKTSRSIFLDLSQGLVGLKMS